MNRRRGEPAHTSPHRFFRFALATALVLSALSGAGPVSGAHPVDALLPDLAMLQPDDFRLERKPGGVRWLRFSTTIVNIGDGAFDVYGSAPHPSDPSKLTQVTQRIQQGGGWAEHGSNGATMFYAGDNHDHWHVLDLQRMELAFEATPNDAVATGAKRGFCFWDNVDLLLGTPAGYSGSWACHRAEDGTVPMGLSVGWGDEYPATIAFQYIDISHLPYGDYCLTLTADPNGEFIEKNTTNNDVRTLISIRTSGVNVLAQDCVEDTTAPAPPTGLTATAGNGSVTLDWDDNMTDSDLDGYHVYRDAMHIGKVASSAFSDGGLTNGATYCYQVSAVDGSGNESVRSDKRCATPSADSGGSGTVRVAGLTGVAEVKGQSGRWEVFVTITVKDGNSQPVDNATVTGEWSGAMTGPASGTTAGDGTVTVSTGHMSGDEVTFTVTDVAADGLKYDSAVESITVTKP